MSLRGKQGSTNPSILAIIVLAMVIIILSYPGRFAMYSDRLDCFDNQGCPTLNPMIILKRLLSLKMSKKINYPSAERNKFFILEVLQKHIDVQKEGKLLEISSGTGQHAAYFASNLPKLVIQPSEFEVEMFDSIKAWASEVPSRNVKEPVKIDVTSDVKTWGLNSDYDYILNVNMFHVAPFKCSVGFFKNGSQILKNGGLIFTYGPYAVNGILKPQSNVDFDRNIRQRDPTCGVRDIQDLKKIGLEYGISLQHIYEMPANNKCLVWVKNISE